MCDKEVFPIARRVTEDRNMKSPMFKNALLRVR